MEEKDIEERNRGERDMSGSPCQRAIRIDNNLPKECKEMLYELLEECTGKSNPLHLGAQHGHDDFVREFLSQKRELACELNSHGQSPLHLASARGHVGVVKEILKADPGACFVRDQDGMIPLHLAAIKGRLDVLEELVTANKKTAFILTDRGEPILHLCANNKQFKALEKLVNLLKDLDKDFVNLKDNDDSTILHALSRIGDLKVIKFLVEKTEVDVNAANRYGFTPLDVVLETASKIHNGWKIYQLLVREGAKSSSKRMDNPLMGHWIMSLDGGDGKWFIEALMVVAVLMVTVAFQARLNPPGGAWQDTGFHNATISSSSSSLINNPTSGVVGPLSSSPKLVPHLAGQSIMSYLDPGRYNLFALFSDLTLSSSMLVIQVLLIRRFFNFWTLTIVAIILTSVSVVALSLTYIFSMAFISSDEGFTRTYLLVYSPSAVLPAAFAVWLGLRVLSCMLGISWGKGSLDSSKQGSQGTSNSSA